MSLLSSTVFRAIRRSGKVQRGFNFNNLSNRHLATESKTSKSIPPPPEREMSTLAKFLRASFFIVGIGFIAYLFTVDPEDIKKAHQETLDDMKSLERLTEEVQRKTLESSIANGKKE